MQKLFTYCLFLVAVASCKSKELSADEEVIDVKTPVTVTSISNAAMEEFIELNATSAFLQKWIVRANATGYLQSANVMLNQTVNNRQVLYVVKTKEAESIGNSVNLVDSGFHFTGVNSIRANGSGFISQVNHQAGDYVQDGDQLAIITDSKSFVFLLDMPYELRPYVITKKSLEMQLPDGEKLVGTIGGSMPSMDGNAQTQSIILRVHATHFLPENLIAKVKVIKSSRSHTYSVPKEAVLTNETQSEFWVMKLINDSIAVKVGVKKGIETDGRIEILSPLFPLTDRILLTGNYGLGDTAKVQLVKE